MSQNEESLLNIDDHDALPLNTSQSCAGTFIVDSNGNVTPTTPMTARKGNSVWVKAKPGSSYTGSVNVSLNGVHICTWAIGCNYMVPDTGTYQVAAASHGTTGTLNVGN